MVGQSATRIGSAQPLSGKLVPDLDFVPVGVLEEDVGLAGNELTTISDLPASLLDRSRRLVDIARITQSEAEMLDSARLSDVIAFSNFEDHDVLTARRLRLDESGLAINRQHAEHIVVELK